MVRLAVTVPSYYLLTAATVAVNVVALGLVSYMYTQSSTPAVIAAIALGAFALAWALFALIYVGRAAKAGSSKRFGTGSVLVLLTGVVALGAAIAAGYGVVGTGSVYQGVATALFTVLAFMYLLLSFVVSEDMIRTLKRN